MRKVALALVVVTAAVTAASAVAGSNSLDPRALTQARKIKADITCPLRSPGGPKLVVTEASPTGVIESFLLLTADFLGLRVVPADNGIHYAICPVRATCPYPGSRSARPASAFMPRRQALELALRTFLETSATVVSVSLPTPEYVFFLVERDELRESTCLRWRRRWAANPRVRPLPRCDEPSTSSLARGSSCRLASSRRRTGEQSLGAVPLWPRAP